MSDRTKTPTLAYRFSVLSRTLAAAIGGYLLVNLANYALSFLLPMPQYQALLLAMQLSFAFYTLAIIWAFAVRTATRAWLGLLTFIIPLAVMDLYFFFMGAP